MSKCTASQAVEAFEYWLGYYEKSTAAYSQTRDKSAFAMNKGTNNYTYAGYICGINGPGGYWCAMQVSLAILEACGNDKAAAKEVMWGVWPYTACNQLYDAAPASMKGRRGAWTPKPGDVIVFSDNGTTRTHTGMVRAVDKTYVYTDEGNSSNMCRERSYKLTDTYIWGYVRPNYAAASSTTSDPATTTTPDATSTSTASTGMTSKLGGSVTIKMNLIKNGCTGPQVKTFQRICYAYGIKGADGKAIAVDGDFGANSTYAAKQLQKKLGLTQDGQVGKDTWAAILTKLA